MANDTITAPKGFLVQGLHCGIKGSAKPDIAMLVCPEGAKAAGMFTTNAIVSPAVTVSKEHCKSSKIYAVTANSGNANACTGKKGYKNVLKMCSETAKSLNNKGTLRKECKPENVLVASTGIIGRQLPMNLIQKGVKDLSKGISDTQKSGINFAEAILTTDTKVKQATRKINISGKDVTIAATAKGAGMIAPNMATTLSFFTTDLKISTPLLKSAFKEAVGASLNKLTVDGHQSTNDTAIILSSGAADNKNITQKSARYEKFRKALCSLCDDLVRQMAIDAEGATRYFKVVVKSAATRKDAIKAARAIADYPLVKCAVNGGDPNWGRIICAAGSSGVKLKQEKLSCKLDNLTVFRNGKPVRFDTAKAKKIVSSQEHTITVSLGAGKYSDYCYGCDLSREYVSINADYHT
jgi:glutamate N-acetyltransferase/amino-acid N-acetyltransferase